MQAARPLRETSPLSRQQTAATPAPGSSSPWWSRSGVVLAAVGLFVLLLAVVLLRRNPKDGPSQEQRTERDRAADRLVARARSTATGLELVLIRAGTFRMGSPTDEFGRAEDEGPQHMVRITRDFYMRTTEVTVGQFRQFVEAARYQTEGEKDGRGGYGFDPARGRFGQRPEWTWKSVGWTQTDEHPVVNVSWNDARAFCAWVSKKEGKTYDLPTEAEWEYACRAGAKPPTRYQHGNDEEGRVRVGNVADASARAKFSNMTWAIKADDGHVFTAPRRSVSGQWLGPVRHARQCLGMVSRWKTDLR
jgi:formylglycine-generating enzyme required for sulfatase activity